MEFFVHLGVMLLLPFGWLMMNWTFFVHYFVEMEIVFLHEIKL
jgi:hypothetical protein